MAKDIRKGPRHRGSTIHYEDVQIGGKDQYGEWSGMSREPVRKRPVKVAKKTNGQEFDYIVRLKD